VNEDSLILSTYFGERDRAGRRLLADELFDIYGAEAVRASVLLRGAEGFGRLHHMHTDRLLSLSEDLPVVSIAVDARERIEAALERVLAVKRRGLVTLERARLLSGSAADAGPLDGELGAEAKLTVFLGRQERAEGGSAFAAVCELFRRCGFAGATVLLGVDGTLHRQRRRARFFAANADVPAMVVAVGSRAAVDAALTQLRRLLPDPLVTLERVRVCKRDGTLLATPHELPGTDEHGLGLWQKLTVYSSAADDHEGVPLHLEIIRRLRAADAAGATSLRGIWGFHGDHAPHGDRLLRVRRHVPVVTIAIDTPERSERSFAIIDALTVRHGLVTSELVPALAAISEERRRGGLRLARHRA
jgi:PII-like signaling protein